MPAGLKIREYYVSSGTRFQRQKGNKRRKAEKKRKRENKGGDEYFIERCLRMGIGFQYWVWDA